MGRTVRVLVDGVLESGEYTSGVRLASEVPGVCLVALSAPRGPWRQSFTSVR